MFHTDPSWVVTLNVCGWPLLQIFCQALVQQLPASWCPDASTKPAKVPWWYEQVLHIRAWKAFFNNSGWFVGGFNPILIHSHQPTELVAVAQAMWRLQWTHALTLLLAVPYFFSFNPPWLAMVMLGVGLIMHLPSLLVQHYNRRRLQPLLFWRKYMGVEPTTD